VDSTGGQLKAEQDPDAPPLTELIELMYAVWLANSDTS